MKVRANNWYTYRPALYDVIDPRTTLVSGERVQVRKMRGCPPPNVMNHAHVFDSAGKFRGLVSTYSLARE